MEQNICHLKIVYDTFLENFVDKLDFKKKPDICNRFKFMVMFFLQFDNFIINVCLQFQKKQFKRKPLV